MKTKDELKAERAAMFKRQETRRQCALDAARTTGGFDLALAADRRTVAAERAAYYSSLSAAELSTVAAMLAASPHASSDGIVCVCRELLACIALALPG